MALRFNRFMIFGTVGMAAALVGCGLSDYEANMASEQARVHRLDKENKYLDDPVEWPAKKEGDKKETGKKEVDKNWVDVFFRPPRGINRKPEAKQRGTLYVFRRTSDGTGNIQEIWIGTAVSQADFGRDVEKLIIPAGGSIARSHSDRQPPGRKEPLSIDTATYDDASSTYSINVYKKGNTQAVVVYHLDKTKSSETTTKMELSLESLAIDTDAGQERRRFSMFHTKGAGK